MAEVPTKYYEKQSLVNNKHCKILLNALDLVKKFVIREQRMLVGGMAIDFALRLKGDKLYDDDTLPDYDFYSPQHFVDAYEIGQWLVRTGYENVSVINANHPTTMRVRVNFQVVADVTFVPKEILENIPCLNYQGMRIVHPHYQFIDQHHSLSQPFENPPLETIMHRWKKDIKRHDLLYQHYPLRLLNVKSEQVHLGEELTWPLEQLRGACISGFVALNFWLEKAKGMGYEPQHSFGTFRENKTGITAAVPNDGFALVLLSHEPKVTTDKFTNKPVQSFYPLLGIFPKRYVVGRVEVHDFEFNLVSAHEFAPGLHVVNLQHVMKYLLAYYIVIQKIKGEKRGYSHYVGYLECRRLLQWASDHYCNPPANHNKEDYLAFLPTPTVYGKQNLSESYRIAKERFQRRKNNEPAAQITPKNLYAQNMIHKTIPPQFLTFDLKSSEIFLIDGSEIPDKSELKASRI